MKKAVFKNIRSEIMPFLKQANENVVVAMAWFTSGELFQALIDCLKRNVKVELVLLDNAINFMYYAPDFNLLIKAGGILRIAKPKYGFMHHKFCVIDNKIVITGSYNWTYFAETRNIENIVIFDEKDVVEQYKREFDSLTYRISKVTNSPRLSWDEIGRSEDINIYELNYEIEKIAKFQNLPLRTVVKSSPIVTIEERPLNPISKYNIGIRATEKGDNSSMLTIIPIGTKLPFTSEPKNTWNYEDVRNKIICTILYSDGTDIKVITEKAITEITAGRKDWELNIKIQFTLLQNGDLLSEIRCVESGRVMTVKVSNPDFVDYEK